MHWYHLILVFCLSVLSQKVIAVEGCLKILQKAYGLSFKTITVLHSRYLLRYDMRTRGNTVQVIQISYKHSNGLLQYYGPP